MLEGQISRRRLFKLGAGIALGALSAKISVDAMPFEAQATQAIAGRPMGNAGTAEDLKKECGERLDNPEYQKCEFQAITSDDRQWRNCIESPMLEEITCRVIPSAVTSVLEGRTGQLIPELILGTGKLGLSRRETIVGFISSVLFASLHNITEKGFSTSVIPVSPFIGGVAYWYLQRKFGLCSNVMAHMAHNAYWTRNYIKAYQSRK